MYCYCMARKCISTYTGKPRAIYHSYEEALKAADSLKQKGLNYYPYKCNGCGMYHIAPEEDKINFVEHGCGCTDSNGNWKNLYRTYEDAAKAGAIAMSKRNVVLKIYECPEKKGWHLTHEKTFLEKHWKPLAVALAAADMLLLAALLVLNNI